MRDTKKLIPLAVVSGLWATALYAVVLHSLEILGYSLSLFRMPDYCYDYWLVTPGAILFSWVILALASPKRGRSVLLGGLLGALNAPIAVLTGLVIWELKVRLGLAEPWRYGFEGLWNEWLHQWLSITLVCLPVSLPCGMLMGGWISRRSQSQLFPTDTPGLDSVTDPTLAI